MADLFGKPKKLGKEDPSTKKWSGRLHDAFVNTLASQVTPEMLNPCTTAIEWQLRQLHKNNRRSKVKIIPGRRKTKAKAEFR